MASVYSYTAIQNAVIGLPIITFTDTSTLEGVTLTNRKIYLELDNGTWLTENGITTTRTGIDWAAGENTKQVSVLTQDYSVDIEVEFYGDEVGEGLLINDTDSLLINSVDSLLIN